MLQHRQRSRKTNTNYRANSTAPGCAVYNSFAGVRRQRSPRNKHNVRRRRKVIQLRVYFRVAHNKNTTRFTAKISNKAYLSILTMIDPVLTYTYLSCLHHEETYLSRDKLAGVARGGGRGALRLLEGRRCCGGTMSSTGGSANHLATAGSSSGPRTVTPRDFRQTRAPFMSCLLYTSPSPRD